MDLLGRKIVVTAGGTREPIDPVRFVGNRSSGKMGFALAEAACERGAQVTLITTVLPPKYEGYGQVCEVETTMEMRKTVLSACKSADVLLMAAAVADYRIAEPRTHKIKKDGENLKLEFVKNADFLLELPDTFIKIGFAAETENILKNARDKLKHKRLSFICANDVSSSDAGFGVDTNRITILYPSGKKEALPLMRKIEVAHEILHRVVELLDGTENRNDYKS
ncbi:MAG: Coenzyme A biosynthesis bifunctional protein CoaBC [Candidatus Moanabacter tarae]|uniref:Coenzyme A biosynthesis bifunctional protein CoaBC n=1 Tax=Candidatus Moanibacter tarae TaxID=2200854 RepID=A0A2Z4AM23_9BACT|nr:MAG: Coenzyme A biosynthesis bifunctional protein CoaBC [Candidatus Moanabacter tarae]